METNKPTIASRRTFVSHPTALSINTDIGNTRNKESQGNMSHEELTSKIADSFQEFSSMLSQLSSSYKPLMSSPPVIHHTPLEQHFKALDPPISPPTTLNHDESVYSQEESSDDEDFSASALLLEDLNVKGMRLRSTAKCLAIVVCKGRAETLAKMIQLGVDLNRTDDKKSGVTPLMYAAYLGKIDCLNLLLQHSSIQVNKQDKKGWTALLWGLSGCQVESVKLLLMHGAAGDRTKMGRTIDQYPTCNAIKEVLGHAKINENNSTKKVSLPTETQVNETIMKSITQFNWNRCLPDQMFVFTHDQIPLIVDRVFSLSPDTIQLLRHQSEQSSELWAPANIVFLCARFAHYNFSRELLNLLLDAVMARLSKVIKGIGRDQHSLSFWIANLCQLINYLKKDNGLSIVTLDAQEFLSQAVTEAYTSFVTESQRKLEKVLEPSLMEHDPIDEPIEFVDDWQRFFFKRNSLENASCPQVLTEMLGETQGILQSYHVPPAIVIQATAQFLFYISCEVFNRTLSQKKYLCRSKALQIRLNLSTVEEWLKTERLPSSLNRAFEPLIQLLQLLQCLSQMGDMATFISTVGNFDRLNPLQIKKCVQSYRYEISEPKLPDHIESLAEQMASTQTKERRSLNLSENKRSSVSSLNSLIAPKNKRLSTPERSEEDNVEDDQEGEKKNSKYLLPFSVFSTTALLQDWTEEKQKRSISRDDYADTIYHEIKLKKLEKYDLFDKIIPSVPYEWLYHLDKKLRS